MKCYRHHEVEAVAICVHCGKAVCSECENEGETHRITCSETCGEAAARHNVLRTVVAQQYTANVKVFRGVWIFVAVFGLLVLTGGIGVMILEYPYYDWARFGIAVLIILLGSMCLVGSYLLRGVAEKYRDIVRKLQ
jgi:hypothetical protein